MSIAENIVTMIIPAYLLYLIIFKMVLIKQDPRNWKWLISLGLTIMIIPGILMMTVLDIYTLNTALEGSEVNQFTLGIANLIIMFIWQIIGVVLLWFVWRIGNIKFITAENKEQWNKIKNWRKKE